MSEHRARVLLADDDESFRRVQEYQLDRAGYRVTSVADGESALDAFREGLHDLVVTDVRMPGLDGRELIGRVRAEREDQSLNWGDSRSCRPTKRSTRKRIRIPRI